MNPRNALTLLAIVATVAASMLALSGIASADGFRGRVELNCTPNADVQADPMEQFGVTPSLHLHTPVGANVFGPLTTLPEMIDSQTSCDIQSDHSLLWFPTPLRPDGTPATINRAAYYLANSGYVLTAEPPNGLKVLGGSPSCTTKYCNNAVFFCRTPSGGEYEQHTIPPAGACAAGAGYQEDVSTGQCWNGENFGPGMGSQDGPGGDSESNFTFDNPCTSGYVVPQIVLSLFVASDGVGGCLSSDIVEGSCTTAPGSTAHINYVFGWTLNSSGASSMGAIVQDCLNQSPINTGISCVDTGGEIYRALTGGEPDYTQPVTN